MRYLSQQILLGFNGDMSNEHKFLLIFAEKKKKLLCQFILDPTSINLPERINLKDPYLDPTSNYQEKFVME